MTHSIPGLLVSRDGTVREYVGHSKRTGALLGKTERVGSTGWRGVCAGCGARFTRGKQREVLLDLRFHWIAADASHPAAKS